MFAVDWLLRFELVAITRRLHYEKTMSDEEMKLKSWELGKEGTRELRVRSLAGEGC